MFREKWNTWTTATTTTSTWGRGWTSLTSILFKVICFLCFAKSSNSYCWQPGWNPNVKWAPSVQQVNLVRVRVTWNESFIDNLECADQFVVKYWRTLEPGAYAQTPLLPTSQFSVDLEVFPLTEYAYQLIAREDKGFPFGVDYNKGPLARMATVRNPQVKPDEELNKEDEEIRELEESIVRANVRRSEVFEIVGFFTMLVVVALLLALLALMLVPLFRACKPLNDDQDTDDQQADIEQA